MSVDVQQVIKKLTENEIPHCSKTIKDERGIPITCRMIPIPYMSQVGSVAVKGSICMPKGQFESWDADRLDKVIDGIMDARKKEVELLTKPENQDQKAAQNVVKKSSEKLFEILKQKK